MNRIIVAILNYNGKRHLETYMPDVIKHTPADFAEIVLIDNASTDDSLAWFRQAYPQLRVVILNQNYGFAGGYNEGLKGLEAEYFVLLSSDVRVSEHWLTSPLALMDADPQIAALQPKVLSDVSATDFDYAGAAGGWIDRWGIPFAMGRIFDKVETDHAQYQTQQRIFWASGCALFVRARCYREVHGMYPYLFAHQEEIDMCWRFSLLGYKVVNCPDSRVYHLGGGTLNYHNPFKVYLNVRNNMIIIFKNLPLHTALRIFLFRVILDHSFALVECLRGNFKKSLAIFHGYTSFFKWYFSKDKDVRYIPGRKGWASHGVYKGSIVFAYYLRGKRTFSALHINTKQ